MVRRKRRSLAGAFALAAIAWATIAGGPRASAQNAAEALYDSAYDRWAALPLAAFATYDGRITFVRNAKSKTRLETIAYRRSDRRCRIAGVALDARDKPDATEVTDRCFAPDYAFTFVPQSGAGATAIDLDVPTPAPSGGPEAGGAAAPKTIGAVHVRVRPYAVVFAGDEMVEGKNTAHLSLRPFRDPKKNVLRDVWIDRLTNGVVRLRGEASAGPNVLHVVFDAYYSEDASSQTLRRVEARAKAQFLFLRESGTISLELTNIAYPSTIPNSFFGGRD